MTATLIDSMLTQTLSVEEETGDPALVQQFVCRWHGHILIWRADVVRILAVYVMRTQHHLRRKVQPQNVREHCKCAHVNDISGSGVHVRMMTVIDWTQQMNIFR